MFVFSGIFIYEIAMMYFYKYLKNKDKCKLNTLLKCCVLFGALFLPVFIYGMRDFSIGTDTISYKQIFNFVGSNFSFKHLTVYEFGYSLLNAIIYSITNNFTILLFLCGIIIFGCAFFAILKLSEDSAVSIAIYVGLGLYAQSFNAIRQYIAFSLILIGLVFLMKKNQWWTFLIVVLFATLFHKTAICALVILPFKYIKFNWIILGGMGICSILGIILFPYLAKLFDLVFKTGYYNSYNTLTDGFTVKNIMFLSIILIALMLSLLFRNKVKNMGDEQKLKNFDFYLYNLIVFTIIKIISMFTVELLDRVGLYFMFSVLFIVPIILNSFEKKTKIILTLILYLGLFVFMNMLLIKMGAFGVVPYKFI